MRKLFPAVFFSFIMLQLNAQTLQSPEQFLGYKIGTNYTRHYKIVEYFKTLAAAKSDMVKVEQYGTTNEGRELILAYVTSADNLKKLEEIRKNNLSLTKEKNASTNNPAIVWLSYNVHGNEPSSSEAAMQTLYALVNPANTKTKEWLQNTVVIIEPCMNPDGRDRYVNWFNGVKGKEYNIDPQSREHREPWPGGRTNHYNFDLNRDWAWQTQIESQQRMKKYNEWLPQIHVDFHEQGYNNPYYFAPAAEPFHEVITPWQRDFQTQIGKNNAKYFDENAWLYFTRENFDLFYPSYGDTYPLYNGAIGMTYEQGGHSAGGLGVLTNNGDTLTLVDRVIHHYTTGLATIEIASKNAQKLLEEFKKYFDDSRNAKNTEYKTYVVTDDDESKIKAVKKILENNNIEYGTITTNKIKGYRYFTLKEEEVSLKKYNLAVSMYQPKSTLVKVLFEQQSKLSDSATYDITAWALPYNYGVEGIAVKEKLEIKSFPFKSFAIKEIMPAYGYLFPYTSLNSAKLLAYLLKNNVKVRQATKPFTSNGKQFERGTLIIIKTSNTHINLFPILNTAAQKFQVQPDIVLSGFVEKGADFGSKDVVNIATPKVAMLTGEQVSANDAGEVWNFFDETLNYPITLLNATDLARLNINKYNVLILPDGNYRTLNDKNVTDKLKEFVSMGGKIIAIQNAVEVLAKKELGLKIKETKEDGDKKDEYADLKKYGDREREFLPNSTPGAIYKVELDNTHPLAYGYPDFYYTLKQDDNTYEFLKNGWNVGVLKKNNYITGFAGYKAKNKLKDTVIFGVEDIGNGAIVYMADNPLFRLFWENGKLLFANAVFLVGE
ncbi:MAG: zinc carboxypeptidase [Bacteroidetes bacterium]|nr:zinc carboxypeptidase [Bacteroidota bacterium]